MLGILNRDRGYLGIQPRSRPHVALKVQGKASPTSRKNFNPNRVVAVMKLTVDMGRVSSLAAMIDCRGSLVRAHGSHRQLLALHELERFLARALKFETEHGQGSQLQLQHPFVQGSIEYCISVVRGWKLDRTRFSGRG
jgi:hypothetical protein